MRSWTCSNFNTQHARHVNAAINIRDEGLRLLALGTSATASESNIRPRVGRKSSGYKAVAVEAGSPHVPQARSVSGSSHRCI
jgi:putative transposase